MDCPHCKTPLLDPATGVAADPPPRFCDACGRATGFRPKPKAPAVSVNDVRCPECGLSARTARCRGCGAKVRWPEGVEPPGEER